jgi:hypothetical protein
MFPSRYFRARFPRAPTDTVTVSGPARAMTASFLRTRTLSAAGALDRRLHTSPRARTDTFTGPASAKPARNSFHDCKLLSAVRLSSSHCTRPHPCTVTAAHHPHTRPPDIPARLAYQRSLVNTYSTSDQCRSERARRGPRRDLALMMMIFYLFLQKQKIEPEANDIRVERQRWSEACDSMVEHRWIT